MIEEVPKMLAVLQGKVLTPKEKDKTMVKYRPYLLLRVGGTVTS